MSTPNTTAPLAEIRTMLCEIKEAVTQSSASPWLNTEQAAAYMGFTAATLKSWRRDGIGPPFCKRGRLVRYDRNKLDEWLRK